MHKIRLSFCVVIALIIGACNRPQQDTNSAESNNSPKTKKYKFEDDSHLDLLSYKMKDDTSFEFTLNHIDKSSPKNSFTLNQNAVAVDPEGNAKFEEDAPSGEEVVVEWYAYEGTDRVIDFYLPEEVGFDFVTIKICIPNRDGKEYKNALERLE